MNEFATAYGVGEDDSAWVVVEQGDMKAELVIQRCLFLGPPSTTHIQQLPERIVIQDVTMIAGHFTPSRAIRWAVSQWLTKLRRNLR